MGLMLQQERELLTIKIKMKGEIVSKKDAMNRFSINAVRILQFLYYHLLLNDLGALPQISNRIR